jgi:hypothetical protein
MISFKSSDDLHVQLLGRAALQHGVSLRMCKEKMTVVRIKAYSDLFTGMCSADVAN